MLASSANIRTNTSFAVLLPRPSQLLEPKRNKKNVKVPKYKEEKRLKADIAKGKQRIVSFIIEYAHFPIFIFSFVFPPTVH